MKRLVLSLMMLTLLVGSASAMSYKTAREQALFLTDKMAYELNLYDDQYNACYEINLDYIMCVDTYSDLFGTFWTRRNTELSYVLTAEQYQVYLTLEYFYRPISYVGKRFVFSIFDRYPKGRYFRAAPPAYQVYRGGNRYYNNSPYKGRSFGGGNRYGTGGAPRKDIGGGHATTPKPATGGGNKGGGVQPGGNKGGVQPGGNMQGGGNKHGSTGTTKPSTGGNNKQGGFVGAGSKQSGSQPGGNQGGSMGGGNKQGGMQPGGNMTKRQSVNNGKQMMKSMPGGNRR